jgi:hypothetical protein
MTRTIIGHPRVITENFGDLSSYFGLVKCTVLPPRGLFHPVLPYRTQGKLIGSFRFDYEYDYEYEIRQAKRMLYAYAIPY